MKHVKYFFPTSDGAVFIVLPELVSRKTLFSIISDCGFSKCYVLVDGVKVFLDF